MKLSTSKKYLSQHPLQMLSSLLLQGAGVLQNLEVQSERTPQTRKRRPLRPPRLRCRYLDVVDRSKKPWRRQPSSRCHQKHPGRSCRWRRANTSDCCTSRRWSLPWRSLRRRLSRTPDDLVGRTFRDRIESRSSAPVPDEEVVRRPIWPRRHRPNRSRRTGGASSAPRLSAAE